MGFNSGFKGLNFCLFWRDNPQWARSSSFTRFLDHILSGWLLWTNDQLVAETSTWQHSQQTCVHAPGRIRTHSLSRWAASDLRLRPRGHWDRPFKLQNTEIKEEISVQRLVTVHSGRSVKGKLYLSRGSSSSYVCHAFSLIFWKYSRMFCWLSVFVVLLIPETVLVASAVNRFGVDRRA